MNLYTKIQDDIKDAMRGKDLQTLDTLRLLFSSLKNKAIDLKRELEDAEVIVVVRSDMKKLQDAMIDYKAGAREDLIIKSKEEIEILKKYLPPEMSDEDLEEIVSKKITEMGTPDIKMMGKVMGAIMADVKDRVDGTRVREMVSKILSPKE